MKNYYRVLLGTGNAHAQEALRGNFIGSGDILATDLTHKTPEQWRKIYLKQQPEKSRRATDQVCQTFYRLLKEMTTDDIVLCGDEKQHYYIGKIIGVYQFRRDSRHFPHQRPVRWYLYPISKKEMSSALRALIDKRATVVDITDRREEIKRFMAGNHLATRLALAAPPRHTLCSRCGGLCLGAMCLGLQRSPGVEIGVIGGRCTASSGGMTRL